MDQRSTTAPSMPPRTHSRTFSFRSDKSGQSGTSARNDAESPREKERRDSIWKANSKANPNAALAEAQPQEINQLEKTTIEPLRTIQHKDIKGNVITDPDLSNPTRPRMERPLDTIRSFEKAIDSGYKRRTSMMRGESHNDTASTAYASRRSSYVGGYDNGPSSNRGYQNGTGGGFYGSRRPDSYADGPNGPNGYPQRMRYAPRGQSDSAVPRSTYPGHHYQQSQDTNGSDSTGQWANSTDPSSENSSIERMHATTKPYGPQDGMQNPIMENGEPPRPPQHSRQPIQLGQGPPLPPKANLPSAARPEQEKKKGWLSRRFSKKI